MIGGDQLGAFEGTTLGKAGTAERAIEQLAGMSGLSHELITALFIKVQKEDLATQENAPVHVG